MWSTPFASPAPTPLQDPYDCMLLYLALGRKPLLLSLFRQAGNRKVAGAVRGAGGTG